MLHHKVSLTFQRLEMILNMLSDHSEMNKILDN